VCQYRSNTPKKRRLKIPQFSLPPFGKRTTWVPNGSAGIVATACAKEGLCATREAPGAAGQRWRREVQNRPLRVTEHQLRMSALEIQKEAITMFNDLNKLAAREKDEARKAA